MAFDDETLRAAAFERVRRLLVTRRQLSSEDLRVGFFWNGIRLPLVNPQRGIFKPRQMEHLLSIRTVFPRPGSKVWYDDQRIVHQQIYSGEEAIDYAFMGDDPMASENQWMRRARDERIPIIYFLGVAPGVYEALRPAFIVDWDPVAKSVKVAFGESRDVTSPVHRMPEVPERRYALRLVKQRLHQSVFRQAVIDAYQTRCALSGLPEPLLLDAAHIVPDVHERLGHPVVQNGIPLSKLHHAAFDAHLLGIDADFKVHVAERLRMQNDGPILEALKGLDGRELYLPRRLQDRPDQDRLVERFKKFCETA